MRARLVSLTTVAVLSGFAPRGVARAQDSLSAKYERDLAAFKEQSLPRIVMSAVVSKLAPWMAGVALDSAPRAWQVRLPLQDDPAWARMSAWLKSALRARDSLPGDPTVSFVSVDPPVIRGDSLTVRFTIGTHVYAAHRTPSTVYELRTVRSGGTWRQPPDIRVLLYLD